MSYKSTCFLGTRRLYGGRRQLWASLASRSLILSRLLRRTAAPTAQRYSAQASPARTTLLHWALLPLLPTTTRSCAKTPFAPKNSAANQTVRAPTILTAERGFSFIERTHGCSSVVLRIRSVPASTSVPLFALSSFLYSR